MKYVSNVAQRTILLVVSPLSADGHRDHRGMYIPTDTSALDRNRHLALLQGLPALDIVNCRPTFLNPKIVFFVAIDPDILLAG